MSKSQQTFEKNEREKKRQKKKEEKRARREERKAAKAESDSGLDSMMAYIDENGNIVDTPPDPSKKKKVDASSIQLGVPKREKVVIDTNHQGRVDFFNDSKGYGFIKEDGSGESYFVHINGCVNKIKEGDVVTYELEKGQKGMMAVKVKIVK